MVIYMHNRPTLLGLLDRYRVWRELMRDTRFEKKYRKYKKLATDVANPSPLMTSPGAEC